MIKIWHYRLLPYLPQKLIEPLMEELVKAMRDWRDKSGIDNPDLRYAQTLGAQDFSAYWFKFSNAYQRAMVDNPVLIMRCRKYDEEFKEFNNQPFFGNVYRKWHNEEYLEVCMAILYDLHNYNFSENRIDDSEWYEICRGYEEITGREYSILREVRPYES